MFLLLHKTRQQTDARIVHDLYFVFEEFKFAGGFGDIIIIISTTPTTTRFLYCEEKNDDDDEEENNVWEEFDDFRRRREMEAFLLQ